MSQVQRIQELLRSVQGTLWSSIRTMLNRGETVETLAIKAQELEASSRTFEVKVEAKNTTLASMTAMLLCPCWPALRNGARKCKSWILVAGQWTRQQLTWWLCLDRCRRR